MNIDPLLTPLVADMDVPFGHPHRHRAFDMRFTATPMLAALAFAVLLASCASDDNSEPAVTQAAVVTTTTTPASEEPSSTETDSSELTPPTTGLIDSGLQPYIDAALDDLSGRLDVGISGVQSGQGGV